MKKLLLLLAVSATIFSCSKDDDNDVITPEQEYAVLTFEDADYKGVANYLGNSDWSSLIDEEYYGAPLIYGTMDEYWCYNTEYNWYDEGNTELASEMLSGWYGKNFSGGGHAISNHTLAELTDDPYYDYQLSVVASGNGGYDGSENFAVHYGYSEGVDYSTNPDLPNFYFKDGTARVVDHMYVIPNNLAMYFFENGDNYSITITDEDYVVLTAAGYDATGSLTGTVSIDLLRDGSYMSEWTKFDLSSLGEVLTVKFNISGTPTNSYGFAAPAYFAYDNVTVQL